MCNIEIIILSLLYADRRDQSLLAAENRLQINTLQPPFTLPLINIALNPAVKVRNGRVYSRKSNSTATYSP